MDVARPKDAPAKASARPGGLRVKLGRRNLSDDQRAMIADEAAEQESKLAVSEKLAKARAVKAGSMATTASAIGKPKDRTPRSTEKASKAARVSERKLAETIRGLLSGPMPFGKRFTATQSHPKAC